MTCKRCAGSGRAALAPDSQVIASEGLMVDQDCEAARFLASEIDGHQQVAEATRLLGPEFARMHAAVAAALAGGKKLLFFGNGGSAADAQHLATELVVRYRRVRRALPAIALTTDTSALTAIANDMSFEQVFSRQIEGLGQPGDVAVGISTSGNSPNVLAGLAAARAAGLITIGLSGGTGGGMRDVSDILLIVPSSVTARIQEMHILIGHALCDLVERGVA